MLRSNNQEQDQDTLNINESTRHYIVAFIDKNTEYIWPQKSVKQKVQGSSA